MRLVRAAAVLAALSACGAPPPATAPPAVEQVSQSDDAKLILRIAKNPLPTTEPLIVELELRAPESRKVQFPDEILPAAGWLANGSQDESPRLLDGGRVSLIRRYELEPLGPGELSLPSIEVQHWPPDDQARIQTIASEPVSVTIEPYLDGESLPDDEAEQAELLDIRGPVDAPVPWWWWLAGALLAAALGYGFYSWRQARAGAPAQETQQVLPPPHVAALDAIDRLVADRLPEQGEHKLFYGLLSNILRRYVEDRYGIRAPERTTEEFLVELRSGEALGPAHQSLLKMFLEHADLVKFAELNPAPDQASHSVELCRRLIRETAPPPPSAVAGS